MKKPVIGITTDVDSDRKHQLNTNYVTAVKRAGGLPLILPIGVEEDAKQVAHLIDGIILTGGGDIDPTLFDEEPHALLGEVSPTRDSLEIALAKEMLQANKPILGICRGLQILNVALGGAIIQDIHSQSANTILQHSQKATRSHQSHFVQVKKESILESIAETTKIKVNSFHHQAVKDVPKPLKISGTASDGIIEAVESTDHDFVLGVQWHPEALAEYGEVVSLRLFDKFVEKCKESRS
ncbi:gamma-glutamyl-gamma-aminobutyrate hydrolase family protein [Sporosarcina sp. Marseille-Q4063]|uniref:gamma-glutamyl-gamma-aminobutyrate hydrolase family protein n=1 Tax=Sporosarcina sp. Marseille-Q4063 TaxID=2810514 RepID=UPI001BB09EC5|nr:gamma-glutamyl-gamma-aminobutyrate hydrolase family protein [Sporosarcina sp. Marseille-Q4063]QUW23127.1 gamma-glutamyl-gamma-aminobutyrate hydrolase family protein [Sporosarcina sp. Marseille-Q4063]